MNSSIDPILGAQIIPRRSEERGQADHGWLKAFHTFDFAAYRGSGHNKFGSLRVINEDRIAGETGFDTHSHAEFEIWTYMISGEVEHKDSMGNTEIMRRGDIQLTSAGTGISHSENAYGSDPVHLLQIWALPYQRRLQPKYFMRHFSDNEKENRWVKVVAPADAPEVKNVRELAEGERGPAPVHSHLCMYASLLNAGKSVTQGLTGKKAYIHIMQTSGYNPDKASSRPGARVRITVGGSEETLGEGDAAYIALPGIGVQEIVVENVGDRRAEMVLFDIEA